MKKCKLNEVSSLIAGFPFDGHKYSSEGIRVVRGDNVTIGNLRWDIDKRWNYPFKEAQTYSLRNEDIVIGMDGSRVGRNRAIVSESDLPLYLAQRVACVRHNEKSIQKYLYYAIFSDRFEQYIKTIHTGTSIPHISLEQLGDFEFILPSISEQEKIGNLLFDIDQKISLNTRMNVELEAMAKQLYDYWFVQFDFPDENGKPYKSSGGKMVWNEKLKREIPEGWEVKNLFHIAKFTNGIACQNFRPTNENKLPVIKIKEMHDGFGNDTEYATTNIPENVKVHNKDVLFSWSASLEVMLWSLGEGALNQHIFKVTSNNGYPKSFYFYQLLEYVDIFKKIAEARKTTMGHITQDHLEQSAIIVPPDLTLPNLLEKRLFPIMDKIVKLNEEKKHLTHLRDSLLPMLMNGQVTIE